jgi:hypothetical protein
MNFWYTWFSGITKKIFFNSLMWRDIWANWCKYRSTMLQRLPVIICDLILLKISSWVVVLSAIINKIRFSDIKNLVEFWFFVIHFFYLKNGNINSLIEVAEHVIYNRWIPRSTIGRCFETLEKNIYSVLE